ncbi:MAG: BCCT family transporter, partial [Micrococcus sp.]|nr:BCCT family transporter [Micrococcus sp.]
ARESVVWTLFHYGITGWGMYALMGIALGYFAHRKGLPLAVRSALYPLVGKRIRGGIGHATDIATVLGTIFGVATSLGIGVVMLNVGLGILFGIGQGLPAQTGLVIVAVTVATISAVSGVDKGIRILSQLNVLLSLALAAWVLFFGDTTFLLRAAVMNVGDFVSMFPGMTLDTMAYDYPAEWMSLWTLFFWAWWIAWASFVGMFLARISRGRTIGQFVVGTLSIPFAYIIMWVTMFGNAAVQRIREGDAVFGEEAMNIPENGFYGLLQDYPGAWLLVALATFTGLLFYITSADSGSLVMANLSSHLPTTETDAKPWLRILWAVATGIITMAMLIVGGITALQYATIVMSVPFAIVMVLVMWGLHRALSTEHRQTVAYAASVRSLVGNRQREGRSSWRSRLAQQFGSVTERSANEHLDRVVLPALADVAGELAERGVASEVVERTDVGRGIPRAAALLVHSGPELTDFAYEVQVRQAKAPSYGGRMIEADDRTFQLDVLVPGGGLYDVMGYSSEQVAHDVLNHYGCWVDTMGGEEAAVL